MPHSSSRCAPYISLAAKIILAFIVGAVITLALRDGMLTYEASVIEEHTEDVAVLEAMPAPVEPAPQPQVAVQTCQTHDECPSPIDLCVEGGCVPLIRPVGECTDPVVLKYTEPSTGKAKYTYCGRGCVVGNQGARCL